MVYHNIYATSDVILERALKNRFRGFRAELDFIGFVNSKRTALSGGYLVPLRYKMPTLSSPVYFTVDNKNETVYRNLYEKVNAVNLSKLLYVRYNNSDIKDWKKIDVMNTGDLMPVPGFRVFDFQGNDFIKISDDLSGLINLFTHKSARRTQGVKISTTARQYCISLINDFDLNLLIELYVGRLIFDGYIGFAFNKGIPSDIDLVVESKSKKLLLIEIKEKDISKTNPKGFGIDVRRLKDCLQLSAETGLEYRYVVRQVNNQTERKFEEWKWISFEEFEKLTDKKNIKNGGVGMGTIGDDNPTVMVAYEHFKNLKLE
ncbi:MAG: hypothetical protein WDM90_17255 [Ferruginibacter sp.]